MFLLLRGKYIFKNYAQSIGEKRIGRQTVTESCNYIDESINYKQQGAFSSLTCQDTTEVINTKIKGNQLFRFPQSSLPGVVSLPGLICSLHRLQRMFAEDCIK